MKKLYSIFKILTLSLSIIAKSLSEKTCPSSEYYDKTADKCLSCGIKACDQCFQKDSKIYCQVCQEKTFLKDNTCNDCQQNCLKCDDERCFKCQRSFFPFGPKCLECPDFCISCEFPGRCTLCRTGFYRDEETGKCESPSPFLVYILRLAIFSFCVFIIFLCFFIPRCMKMKENSKTNYLDRYMGIREEEKTEEKEPDEQEENLIL